MLYPFQRRENNKDKIKTCRLNYTYCLTIKLYVVSIISKIIYKLNDLFIKALLSYCYPNN